MASDKFKALVREIVESEKAVLAGLAPVDTAANTADEMLLYVSAGPHFKSKAKDSPRIMSWTVSRTAIDGVRGTGPTLAEAIADLMKREDA